MIQPTALPDRRDATRAPNVEKATMKTVIPTSWMICRRSIALSSSTTPKTSANKRAAMVVAQMIHAASVLGRIRDRRCFDCSRTVIPPMSRRRNHLRLDEDLEVCERSVEVALNRARQYGLPDLEETLRVSSHDLANRRRRPARVQGHSDLELEA